MRRRRQKNPLFARIVGASIVANILIVAIIAKYAAIKSFQKKQYMLTQMMVLPAHERDRVEEAHKDKKTVKQAHAHGKTSPNHSQHSVASNPNKLRVAVGAGKGDDADGGVDQGTKTGTVLPPTTDANTGPKTVAPPATSTDTTARAAATTQAVTAPVAIKPTPQPMPEIIKPQPVKPKDPVYTAAAPVNNDQPKPVIPDDLRADALDKTFTADVTVSPDGMPIDVSLSQSTGNEELDKIALETARKWRFRPATRDGEPVEGRVRMTIEFQVN